MNLSIDLTEKVCRGKKSSSMQFIGCFLVRGNDVGVVSIKGAWPKFFVHALRGIIYSRTLPSGYPGSAPGTRKEIQKPWLYLSKILIVVQIPAEL